MDVESAVSCIKRRIWKDRHSIWGDHLPDYVDMLAPDIAAEVLGLSFESVPEILNPSGKGRVEIAGEFDPQRKRIVVSEKLGPEVARFTGAHEIGHYLLHKLTKLHREISVDARSLVVRDRREREADRFAAQLLMPLKLLRTAIKLSFGESPPILLDESKAFWLDGGDCRRLLDVDAKELDRELAFAMSGTNFTGEHIVPLHRQFRVSKKAMAIRLDELGFVKIGRCAF